MNVYRGEKRFLSVDLAAVLAEGDTLDDDATVSVVFKRGREPVDFVVDDPAAPAVVDTEVRFWVDVPDDADRGNYLVLISCDTDNGEQVVEEAPLLVQ